MSTRPVFQGWPSTRYIEQTGGSKKVPGVEVYQAFLSPSGARVADIMTNLFGIVILIDMLYLATKVETLEFTIGAVAGGALVILVGRSFLQWLFSALVWVRIFDDKVEILRWNETKSFVRREDSKFLTRVPERAADEKFALDRNQNVGRYFSKSGEVCFAETMQKVPFAIVYPQSKAESLEGRLGEILEHFRLGRIR